MEVLNGKLFELPVEVSGRIRWRAMEGETIIEYALAFCKMHKITSPAELKARNSSLLQTLNYRKLTESVLPGRIIEEYEGRKFVIPLKGKLLVWAKVAPEIRNIYAAARCRNTGEPISELPVVLKGLIDRKKVEGYTQEGLPLLTGGLLDKLRHIYKKDEADYIIALWAYGYEPYLIVGGKSERYGVKKLGAPIEG